MELVPGDVVAQGRSGVAVPEHVGGNRRIRRIGGDQAGQGLTEAMPGDFLQSLPETAATICKTLGIGRTTLYRYLS